MNHIEQLSNLKNRYYAMRHGQSMANCEGIIVSKPVNGVNDYGLSEEGRNQVKRSVEDHLQLNTNHLNTDTLIFCSDFKRTCETAKQAHAHLQCSTSVVSDKRLRERNFGDFELTPDKNYQIVWTNDGEDGAHTLNNVESAESVMQRATQLLLSLEKNYQDKTILLVAHGDTLQILQAAFKKQTASMQRMLTHLETAEIRQLVL